jgi:IclR family mhp operon transcriptional activator
MEKGVPIRSLSRGLAVLKAVNRGGSLSMMEIARTSGVPYPTACRIVQTLLHEELIEREPARKRYRPTALVQALAHGFQGHGPLVQASRAHIVELTRTFGWPISLSSHVGHSMIIRDSTHSLTSLTFSSYYPGYSLPILECAAGIVMLSYMSDEEREGVLYGLKLMPQASTAHILHLFETGGLADQVRTDGFAARGNNRFTRNPGKTSSIGVPIITADGVVGTLTLAFFSSALRLNDGVARFAEPLKAAAAAIAHDLSGVDGPALSMTRAIPAEPIAAVN